MSTSGKSHIKIDDLLYLHISDSVPALVTVYNIQTGQYLYVNKASKKIIGYPPEDFMTKGVPFISSLVHPEDIAEITKKNTKALQVANQQKSADNANSIVDFEYRIKHKNGSWRWLHTKGSVFSRNDAGEVETVLNVSLDITERKEAEEKYRVLALDLEKRVAERTEALAESEERYRSFLLQSSEAIWRFELKQPISIDLPVKKQIELIYEHAYLAECNDVTAQMYDFEKAEDIIGTELKDFLPPSDHRNIEYLTAFINSGYRLTGAESHEKDKHGLNRVFENSLIGIVKNKKIASAWGTQRDITERKELEKRKNDFISIASHELRTPLTNIRLYNEILVKKVALKDFPKIEEYVNKMQFQVERLSKLISNVLDSTRIQEGKLHLEKAEFNLLKLVKEVAADYAITSPSHEIEVKGEYAGTVTADSYRISQVISNLLGNAIKFSPNGTKVIVTVAKKENKAFVHIQDFGIGISKIDQKKLFNRFFQTYDAVKGPGGLGLGLFISQSIINEHKGGLSVQSEKGSGSTFTFWLPL